MHQTTKIPNFRYVSKKKPPNFASEAYFNTF